MGAAKALCYGEQVCTKDGHCSACRAVLEAENPYVIVSEPGIPVRRYGTVPPLDDEPVWQVEALAAGARPRTIAEYGGTTVLLAALGAAAVAGCLLYAI